MGLEMALECNDPDLVSVLNTEKTGIEVWSNVRLSKYSDHNELARVSGSRYGTLLYWRNAHVIHDWFREVVQSGFEDGCLYPVSLGQLEELQKTCDRAIRASFLTNDRPEYELHDLKFTMDRIEAILSCFEKNDDGVYPSDPFFATKNWVVKFMYRSRVYGSDV